MIGKLLLGLINFVVSVCSAILVPIDNLLATYIPSLESALVSIGGVFRYATNVIGFAVDLSGISSTAINLIISYWVFVLSIGIVISVIKTAIQWYDKLKP